MLRCMVDSEWLRIAFGQLLKVLREERGLSQAELALESELDQSFLSLMERGERQPSLSTLFAMSEALELEPDEIVRLLKGMKREREDS